MGLETQLKTGKIILLWKGNAMIIQNYKSNMKNKIQEKSVIEKIISEKKGFGKVEKFNQQARQWPYHISLVCHHCLYQLSVSVFQNQKYSILTSELHVPVTSFHGKKYFRETCHKNLWKICFNKASKVK